MVASVAGPTRRFASTLTAQRNPPSPRPVPSSPKPTRRSRSSSHQLLTSVNDEACYAPVFDLFNVPNLRPNEPRLFLKKSVKLPKTYSTADRQLRAQERITDPPPPRRLTMPSPLVFDGPAQPRHAALVESQRLRTPSALQQETRVTAPLASASGRPLSTSAPNSHSLSSYGVEVFDGPAKITRYQHGSKKEKNGNGSGSGQQKKTLLLVVGGGSVAVAAYLGHDRAWS